MRRRKQLRLQLDECRSALLVLELRPRLRPPSRPGHCAAQGQSLPPAYWFLTPVLSVPLSSPYQFLGIAVSLRQSADLLADRPTLVRADWSGSPLHSCRVVYISQRRRRASPDTRGRTASAKTQRRDTAPHSTFRAVSHLLRDPRVSRRKSSCPHAQRCPRRLRAHD